MNVQQVAPHSIDAEKATIGCVLINKEALNRALEVLVDQHFYHSAHSKIFYAISYLASQFKTVDIVTVSDYLKSVNQFEEIGGADYIIDLVQSITTTSHIDSYIQIVHSKYLIRSLISVCTSVIKKCYSFEDSLEVLFDFAEKEIFKISDKRTNVHLLPMYKILSQMADDLENLYKKKRRITGIETGFTSFDKLTSGLQKGNLIILAARPGIGKTALALNIASNVAIQQKKPVAVFSMEMSQQEICYRLISSTSRVPLQDIRTGFFNGEQWIKITQSVQNLMESPLYLDFSSSITSVLSLRSSARRLATELRAHQTQLSLIVIDYLQLMQGGGSTRGENRSTEIADISRSLKALARDLDVPIMALSQLNRSPEERGRDGKPQLSDLRESGAIEQDADVVVFIYREGLYTKNAENMTQEEYKSLMGKAKLLVLKHRNGPLGDIQLSFLKEYVRFENSTDLEQ